MSDNTMTAEEFQKRYSGKSKQGAVTLSPKPEKPTALQNYQALGRLPGRTMNKTEAAYARRLEALKYTGVILWYAFEPINIRLADNTFYKVDFLVLMADMTLQAHEVKGWWTDKARVKTKAAAALMPFPFFGYRLIKGQWEVENF